MSWRRLECPCGGCVVSGEARTLAASCQRTAILCGNCYRVLVCVGELFAFLVVHKEARGVVN